MATVRGTSMTWDRMVSCYSKSSRYYAYSTINAPDKGEVGGSSPPRPTIYFNELPGVVPKTSTHNPAHISLHHLRTHSERRQIFPLRRPCFIAVVLRVQIERRLNLRVTKDSLNGLGFDFRLVHQPVA